MAPMIPRGNVGKKLPVPTVTMEWSDKTAKSDKLPPFLPIPGLGKFE